MIGLVLWILLIGRGVVFRGNVFKLIWNNMCLVKFLKIRFFFVFDKKIINYKLKICF